MLQDFSTSIVVSASDARQDKIDLEYGDWSVAGTRSVLEGFYAALATQREVGRLNDDRRSWSGPGCDENSLSIFSAPTGRNATWRKLPIRRGGRRRADIRPLFDGYLGAHSPPEGQSGSARLRLVLSLNPTRYVLHQPLPATAHWPSLSPSRWALGAPSLFARRQPLITSFESPLHSEWDNVLTSARMMAFGSPQAWPLHLTRYWAAVCTRMNQELLDGPQALGMPARYSPDVRLKSVETYWEFKSNNPIDLVDRLRLVLLPLGTRGTCRLYPNGFAATEHEHVVSLRLRLSAGIFLRVYPKTDRRVRFEIVHNMDENRELIERTGARGTPEQLIGWIFALAVDAARWINEEVLGALRSEVDLVAGHSPIALIREIDNVCARKSQSDALADLLVSDNCVRLSDRSFLRAPVKELLARGVLCRTRPYGRTYQVTRAYRCALRKIQRRTF